MQMGRVKLRLSGNYGDRHADRKERDRMGCERKAAARARAFLRVKKNEDESVVYIKIKSRR